MLIVSNHFVNLENKFQLEMKLIVKDFSGLFVGLGCAMVVEPIHIEVD